MATLSVPAAGYSVVIANFQWEYVIGKAYGFRNVNVTECGRLYRQSTGVVQRHQQVRFTTNDTLIEGLKQLSMIAGRKALPVQWDDGFGNIWLVDWAEAVSLQRDLDFRQTVTVTLMEQA